MQPELARIERAFLETIDLPDLQREEWIRRMQDPTDRKRLRKLIEADAAAQESGFLLSR